MSEVLQNKVTNYYNDVAAHYYKEHFADPSAYPTLLFRQMHIMQLLDVPSKETLTVLDAGCGTGDLLKEMKQAGFGKLYGIDISDSMISIAKDNCRDGVNEGRINLQVGSVLELPFENDKFDIVICSGLVEYLSDDAGWTKEVKRVLKKDGILVLNVTNKIAVRRWTLGPATWLKQLAPVRNFAAFIKEKVLKRGTLNHFPFSIRTHVPAKFDQYLTENGFEKMGHRYFDFCILPYPLDTMLNSMLLSKRKNMEQTADRDYKWNGCGYIVKAKLLSK
ncbi:class I SAM-dependent methyltransferase [Chitinophagaceae bacterium MMS25-I14]